MSKHEATEGTSITREKLIDLLNEDLAREFQAIIAYVNYSQVLKGAAYMNIADELAVHATEELAHAIILSNQIDYLGGMPTTVPKPVKTSEKAEEMLRFDLENENETIRNYRRRVKQCDELGEFATAEHIREILLQEQVNAMLNDWVKSLQEQGQVEILDPTLRQAIPAESAPDEPASPHAAKGVKQ